MSDKEKKRTKVKNILPEKEADELIAFLEEERGNQKLMAEKLGVTRQSISSWVKAKEFPQYCLPYLEKVRLIKQLNDK